LLAHHFTAAGLTSQAISYWQKAGQRALARFANLEAIAHISKGLELLATTPESPERLQLELAMQMTQAAPLIATKGYSASEVEQVFTRAREICQQFGEVPQFFPVVWGMWAFSIVRSRLKTAHEHVEQLLSIAQRQQDPDLLLEAHTTAGITFYWSGMFHQARPHLEKAISLYDASKHSSHVLIYVTDPGVAAYCNLSLTLWMSGYPDQGFQASQKALTLARQLAHPYSLATALAFAATFHQLRREPQATQQIAEEGIALCQEQQFHIWLANGMMMRGWALGLLGQEKEGIQQCHQGVALYQACGAELAKAQYLGLLVELLWGSGQVEEGLRHLDDIIVAAQQRHEDYYEAELHRLKGELMRQKEKSKEQNEITEAEAEACFHQALEIARRQNAKSLELRAAMSLSRLLQQQGKTNEALKTLAEIYNWFTEGFDTPDLKAAKQLLEKLT